MELPGVLALHYLGLLLGVDLNHHCRVHENPQSTARWNDRRIRNELGITCSTTELLRRVVPEAGLEPATTSL